MDYMERAKREEEAPLIEQTFQQHLVEEKIIYEHKQLKEIELSRQHHAGDLQEKHRLSRMLENMGILQERITSRREAEYSRLKKEREDHINHVIAERKQEREKKRKALFYLKSEEDRLTWLREQEEARKLEEAERKKEEEERKTKLDEIAERQRQREKELEEKELEEKERQRREALLASTSNVPTKPADTSRPAEPATVPPPATTPGKYVPRHRREAGARPPEPDRSGQWSRTDDRPPPANDRWGRSEVRRPSALGGGSRLPSSSSSWSSRQG